MGAGISYWILVTLLLVSFASGFRGEHRALLVPEKADGTKGPTPSTGNNSPPSSPVNTSLKSPPPEKPSVPPVPNSPLKYAPPLNNPSVSTPTSSQNHSNVSSPAPLPVGPPPKPENKSISSDNGNSECQVVTCHVKDLFPCLKKDSQKLILIIKNNGEIPMNLTFLDQELKIPGHSSKEVEVKKLSKEDENIILKSGNETCTIPLVPQKSNPNFSMFHPDMDHVTPVHGLYVASLSILLIGCVWGCCKLRKRSIRSNSRVAYQQLEMSSEPPLGMSTNEEREIGWDDHWNDGWDEEEARGKTSTATQKSSSDKNDWEDWDD